MGDVAVVTANFGGYDEPRGAVVQEGYEDAEWWHFTDGEMDVPAPWRAVRSRPGLIANEPRMAAKPFKLTPWARAHIADRLDRYRWIVWLDANMEVTSPHFIHEALQNAACSGAPLTTWKHPRRRRVWDEAMASLRQAPAKYDHRVIEQVEEYRRVGFPDETGKLYACGTLVWNLATPGDQAIAAELGAAWLTECERWTIQDQLSLPFVAWALDVPISRFPVGQVDGYERIDPDHRAGYCFNKWLRIYDHLRAD